MNERKYHSGFGNQFESEAVPGALPVGRNSPQRAPGTASLSNWLPKPLWYLRSFIVCFLAALIVGAAWGAAWCADCGHGLGR